MRVTLYFFWTKNYLFIIIIIIIIIFPTVKNFHSYQNVTIIFPNVTQSKCDRLWQFFLYLLEISF
ncbi:MAG: hypothetical protein N7Q72_06850, partial [Spiroplasma sp. Tabriz.8]|nr:hypothetical protein [Spiroplasma sp. Tabriz.8]